MTLIQLSPSIPVTTPKGRALAIGWIDYSEEHDILWICFQDDTGECWTWSNRDIRAQKNVTMGREHVSPFYEPKDVELPIQTEIKKFDSNSDWYIDGKIVKGCPPNRSKNKGKGKK